MAPAVPTLYHVQYYCSSMPYGVAMELNIPESQLAIKTIDDDYLHKGTEILKVSPRRVVPAMEFPDGSTMLEAGAMVLYLLEEFDKEGKLHPLPGTPTRKKFLQGVVYVVAECYKAAMEVFFLCHGKEKEDRDQEKLKAASEKFNIIVKQHLVKELEHQKDYYLGAEFSAADIMFSFPLMSVDHCDCGLIEGPIRSYLEKLKAHESYRKMYMERHELTV